MVGQEDLGKPLVDFAEIFLKFRRRVEEAQLDLPFIFHAGETLNDGGPQHYLISTVGSPRLTSSGGETDDNLIDALLLGTKRIGHGYMTLLVILRRQLTSRVCRFSIAKHPHLMQICRERNVMIECCPISCVIPRLISCSSLTSLSNEILVGSRHVLDVHFDVYQCP